MERDALPDVADRLDRLSLWLRRQTPPGAGTTTLSTLDTLRAEGPLRVSDLAGRESLTQPGMTALVNRLECDGLAERHADPTDGRAALVRITDAGRAVLAQRHAVSTDLLLYACAGLDDADRAALCGVLPVLDRLLERAREISATRRGAAAAPGRTTDAPTHDGGPR